VIVIEVSPPFYWHTPFKAQIASFLLKVDSMVREVPKIEYYWIFVASGIEILVFNCHLDWISQYCLNLQDTSLLICILDYFMLEICFVIVLDQLKYSPLQRLSFFFQV
jgi:hypothetical protein